MMLLAHGDKMIKTVPVTEDGIDHTYGYCEVQTLQMSPAFCSPSV